MSHFTTIQTQIKDIEALRAACRELQLDLEQNAIARGVGTQRNGQYVIRLKGSCDIALDCQQNGSFTLNADHWSGNVEQEVGKNFGRLLQLYAVHKAAREAGKRGLRVQRTTLNNGTIKLSIGGV